MTNEISEVLKEIEFDLPFGKDKLRQRIKERPLKKSYKPLKRTPLKSYQKKEKVVIDDSALLLSKNTVIKEPSIKPIKRKKPIKAKPYKPKYPYASIFTDDIHKCIFTGDTYDVDPHHIFGANAHNKHLSEKYHFMIPCRRDWHEVATYSIHQNIELNLKYKRLCEEHYINILHKTKDEWIEEFGKWW